MMRLLAFPLSIFLAASLLAEDELPKDPGESLDIEPPLLIQEIPSRGSVQASGRKSEDGSTFGITEVTATDSPDADAEKNMKLKIGVKVRPNTVIDPHESQNPGVLLRHGGQQGSGPDRRSRQLRVAHAAPRLEGHKPGGSGGDFAAQEKSQPVSHREEQNNQRTTEQGYSPEVSGLHRSYLL